MTQQPTDEKNSPDLFSADERIRGIEEAFLGRLMAYSEHLSRQAFDRDSNPRAAFQSPLAQMLHQALSKSPSEATNFPLGKLEDDEPQ